MVTRYDVISRRWSSHFWVKMHVFTTSFKNRSKGLWIKWCKVIIYVLFYMLKAKKYSFSLFLPDFRFLIKSKMATMFGDVTDPQQRRHSLNIPRLEEIKGFPLKAKPFRNTLTYQNLGGGGGHHPPLIPRWGYDFACTSEGWVTFS